MRNVLMSSRVLLVLMLLLATAAEAQAPKVDRAAEKAIIEQTFLDYAVMFMTGDVKKVTTYFNDPIMIIPANRAMRRAHESSQPIEGDCWPLGTR